MTNNELFEIIAARMFAKCLEAHPIGVDFEFHALAYEATPRNEDGELQDRATEVARSTFRWLEREGYIYVGHVEDSISYGLISAGDVSLTGRALAILNAVPGVLQEQRPMRDLILGAVRSGSATAMQEAIKQLIGAAAGAAF
ncbi:hypothetical protein [Novilysobacter defluvii]|uniref:hypothetical protein n=1 Tax=Novilysobacter defluvii TaxID=391738 RepID=UPI0012B50C18|nr:hypothetical protein [Lysobacter defluvii]